MNEKPPNGLSSTSRKMWREIVSKYELRTDELRVLEDACREVDLIGLLERELDGAELIVKGSMGQPVANPMISELRQHRATLQRLLAALKLPDEGVSASRSAAAREAANARWRRGA